MIRLSPKHGLNPSLSPCHICGAEKNEIIIAGKITIPANRPGGPAVDAEAPKAAIWNNTPCDTCIELMKQGVILIEVLNDEQPEDGNPFRTGRQLVVKDAAILKIVNPTDLAANIIRARMAYVPVEAFETILRLTSVPEPQT